MPKNKVSDPITDQEIAFARLVLSGAMTDRRAAEAVGLNRDSDPYTKAKPRVRASMPDHRAAVQQQLVQQEAVRQGRLNLDRDQVLARLWQIANLSPEMTRGSITGQVQALSMIVAMQNFIPNRLGVLIEKKPATPPNLPQIYVAAWRAAQQATSTAPQPEPTPARQEGTPGLSEPALVPGAEEGATPDDGPSHSADAPHFSPSQPQPSASYVPMRNLSQTRELPSR